MSTKNIPSDCAIRRAARKKASITHHANHSDSHQLQIMSKKASKAKAPPKTVVEEEDENSDEDDIYANERQTVSAFAAAGRRPVKKLRIGGGSGGGAKLSIEGPILEMKTGSTPSLATASA